MKNKTIKIIFSFLLIVFITLNVNAGTTLDDCGERGKIKIKMTSDGENAGFDAKENKCVWICSDAEDDMQDMGDFDSPEALIQHATEFITTTVTTTSPSGKGSSFAEVTYQRCNDPKASTSGSGECTKSYTTSASHDEGLGTYYCNGTLTTDKKTKKQECSGNWVENTKKVYDCTETAPAGCTQSGGGDSTTCTISCSSSFGPVKGPVDEGASKVQAEYDTWAAGYSGYSCSLTLSYKCPTCSCQVTPFEFRACSPTFEDENGNEVYCVNPDKLFTTGENVKGSEAVYGIDDFDVTKCKHSYSTVDCGFANILIEGEYYKRKGIVGRNEINLALRLWSYHTNRDGFEGVGLSWVTADFGTEGGCYLSDERLFVPEYYNVYAETYKEYFEYYLTRLPKKDYISPEDQIITGLKSCTKFGVACNSRLDTVNKAFALLYNTIKGNPYMLDHLAEIFPGATGTPTGIVLEPGEEETINVVVEYGEIFNNWEQDVEIDCNTLVAGTPMYNKVKPFCEVKITWYDTEGKPHTQKPESCKKSVGCTYKKVEVALCDMNQQSQKIYVHHIIDKAVTSVDKLENCSSVGTQMMFAFVTQEPVIHTDPTERVETELIPFDLPTYDCHGRCNDYKVRMSSENELKCTYDDKKSDSDVFTGYIKDPSLRCIANMPSPTEKYKYDYSQQFGVNTNFCRVYCSDEVEYTLGDKVTIESGEDYKLDIRGKVSFGHDLEQMLSTSVKEKRTCMSEIYYARNFTSTVDWETVYGISSKPSNISQLYQALKEKAGSESDRTENLNQVLYDLYNCNFYTEAQIKDKTGGKVTKPRENTNGDVITYALNKYFNQNDAYGLNYSGSCKNTSGSVSAEECIVMDTITYNGGAEYYGTTPSTNKDNISRVGDGKANSNTKISMDSTAKQTLSSIKHCKDSAANGSCFDYIPSNDLNYTYVDTGERFDTKIWKGSQTVEAPSNDYAFFDVTTEVVFYNDSQFQSAPGTGYVINTKDTQAKDSYKLLPKYSFPTSKDAYYLCNDDTRSIRGLSGNTNISDLATHSCEIKYKFAKVSTYYRKNAPDELSRAVQEKYKTPSCYYDVKPIITTDKCKGKEVCTFTDYKNVNKSNIFPNGIPVNSNWDNTWATSVKSYLEETADDTFSDEYLEYSITLTPAQIKALKQYNKSNSYSGDEYLCSSLTNNFYYNCQTQFMTRLREGSNTNGSYDYGTIDPVYNGTRFNIDSEAKTINGELTKVEVNN